MASNYVLITLYSWKSISVSIESQERFENFSMQSSFRFCKEILEWTEGETMDVAEPWWRIMDLKDDDKFSLGKLGEGDAEKLSW